jgi:hypothetical protein
MRMGKPYDLVFTTKIVAVLTFLFTGRKKSVFLYTFVIYPNGRGAIAYYYSFGWSYQSLRDRIIISIVSTPFFIMADGGTHY